MYGHAVWLCGCANGWACVLMVPMCSGWSGVRESGGVVTMTAITVSRAGHIHVNGAPSGHVDADGSVVVEGDRLGRVERVETVGPRGGVVVEWVAHSPYMHVSPAYGTRAGAVSAVVEAWGTEADVEPVDAVEAPEGATDAPDPVTGVTEAERARYGSVMVARGARMSHTVTSVESVRGTWNVRATASDGTPEHFTVVPSWGDVRWYARGGECVLPLPVGVTFPDTRAGAVEAVITVMSGPVQWADDAEVPVRARVVEWRAGDYVEVSVGGEHHVYTWTDDRGVVRDYLVVMDGHADYGDFAADPVAWVRAYYAGEDVSVEGPEDDDALPESNGAPLGAVARAALDALSGETDVHWTPTESGTGDVSAVVWECGNGGNRNTFRVGVFMSDAGTVFNGMDGAGDYCHIVTDDADTGAGFIRNHLQITARGTWDDYADDAGVCVVCGEPVDYCPGHGYPDSNHAAYVWACHDADYHGECRASCRTEGARGVLIVSREYDPDTDVHDGDVNYAETRAEWHPDVSVLDAVDLLRGEHLTTSADAHGPEVWTEGDARGENVHHYTGVVTETEAYLRGYTDAECAVMAALATGEPWECGGVTVTGVGFRVEDVDADMVDADNVPWFTRSDYGDVMEDDAPRFIPLSDGDVLPVSDVMALRDTFTPGASVMEPDNVHRVLHGASTDSAWSGYGVIYDHDDNTWSVVRMTW